MSCQLRRVGEGAVAAADDDGLKGADESLRVTRHVGIGGELLEEGGSLGGVAGAQDLGHGEGEVAFSIVVLTVVAVVGKVAGDGFSLRLYGGGEIAGVRLDVGKDGPGLPQFGGVTELGETFDNCDRLPAALRPCDVPPAARLWAAVWAPRRQGVVCPALRESD